MGWSKGGGFPENELWACEFLSGFCFLVFFSSVTGALGAVVFWFD